ncbi:acid-sensing ion channel 1-like [Lineus longissimus]|uniref:acid-sensing ion channel 1-like n=1 Tax=Lineus longissimus TaxID=88925 RepID=UPI00315D33D3
MLPMWLTKSSTDSLSAGICRPGSRQISDYTAMTSKSRGSSGYFDGQRRFEALTEVRQEAEAITYQFTQQSSMHGLQYIGSSVNPALRRLFWACCFVASVAFFLNAVIPRLSDYLRNPVLTKISIERSHPMTFPAVTICNFNPYRKSILESRPQVAAIMQSAYKSSSSEYIGLEGINQSDPLINETLHNTINHDIVVEAAHPLLPMIWGCRWDGDDIPSYDFFTTSYTDFGICYTFNSREFQEKNEKLQTNATGSNSGLHLRMTVEHLEYYLQNPLSNSAGIKMMLHDADTLPLVKEYGMAITPGTENFMGIRQVKHSFLPPPAENSHCRDTTGPGFRNPLAFYPTYSYSACRYECLANYTLEKCGCRGALMPGPGNYCTMYEYFACELTMESK